MSVLIPYWSKEPGFFFFDSPKTPRRVSYGSPETQRILSPGLTFPAIAQPIAWVPLTKWGRTSPASALNILA